MRADVEASEGDGVTVEDLAAAIWDEASFFRLVTGHAPFDYQVDMLKDRSRNIIAVCGRQTGKTVAMGVKAMHYTLLNCQGDWRIFLNSLFTRMLNH